MAVSGATYIIVTVADIVQGVRHDVAGNVRGHQTSCKEPSKGSLEQKHDYSNVQEAKYIDMAKDNADETNRSDQDNETTNESFMGIVANVT